jgi:hypothetical protein
VNRDQTVWVVITRDDRRRITDLEMLDSPPTWDLAAHGQVAFVGNVNGGDSVPFASGANDFQVHQCAAVKPARPLKRRNNELTVLKVNPDLWEWARIAADYDYSRITIISETEVIINNRGAHQ